MDAEKFGGAPPRRPMDAEKFGGASPRRSRDTEKFGGAPPRRPRDTGKFGGSPPRRRRDAGKFGGAPPRRPRDVGKFGGMPPRRPRDAEKFGGTPPRRPRDAEKFGGAPPHRRRASPGGALGPPSAACARAGSERCGSIKRTRSSVRGALRTTRPTPCRRRACPGRCQTSATFILCRSWLGFPCGGRREAGCHSGSEVPSRSRCPHQTHTIRCPKARSRRRSYCTPNRCSSRRQAWRLDRDGIHKQVHGKGTHADERLTANARGPGTHRASLR